MSKTLVIILSETRAHELTFNNFKKNVIDELNADLCICIGVKPNYDYTNPFYTLAKYKFVYNEPDDYSDAFNYAYDILAKDNNKYEKMENKNALYHKIQTPGESSGYIKYHGNSDIPIETLDDDVIVNYTKQNHNVTLCDQIYGTKSKYIRTIDDEPYTDTYMKPKHWREFLKIKDQFMGGVKDKHDQHPGSAGILIFFRWFLLTKIIENDLLNQYDRFIITRSDFIYRLPHPQMRYMDEKLIWIPDCEHYRGYTDRHVVLSKNNIVHYLNIFNNMVLKSNEYFFKMIKFNKWNLEKLIKFHLEQNNVLHLVREFPYIMFAVRNINGTTRWAHGIFNDELGCFIKYQSEYDKSKMYMKQFNKSKMDINKFYKKLILTKSYQ